MKTKAGTTKRQLLVRVDQETFDLLAMLAEQERRSLSSMTDQILRAFLHEELQAGSPRLAGYLPTGKASLPA